MASLTRRLAILAMSALALSACGAANGDGAKGRQSSAPAAGSELGHVKGSPTAPITVIEYASPTCPACKFFHDSIQPTLTAEYIETGKVRFIFREFPLNSLDVDAYAMARCAGEGKFFDVLADLFANQEGIRSAASLSLETARGALATVGTRHGIADNAAFNACMQNREIRRQLADVYATGETFGINGTPTFVINGQVRKFEGEWTTADGWRRQLDALLAEKSAK